MRDLLPLKKLPRRDNAELSQSPSSDIAMMLHFKSGLCTLFWVLAIVLKFNF